MLYFTNASLDWLEALLYERYGHNLTLKLQENSLLLKLSDREGVIIFEQLQSVFHQSRSDFPCYTWKASLEGYKGPVGDSIPAPSGTEIRTPLIEVSEKGAKIHYDILGLTYWMLSRLEEVGRTDLDNHQRFPATSSHAYQHGYLERPIVDEWLHILGQVVKKVWPDVELKRHEFSIKVSHDVDSPSLYQFKSWKAVFRMMAGHLIKRRDIKASIQALYIKQTAGKRLHKYDPYNTFNWLMDVSEANGLSSAFYFICGRTSNMDADYEPEHSAIRELMRTIHHRGHEVGLHPSYGTFQNPELIKREAERLRKVMEEEGIQQAGIGGRMHYLRWQHPVTLQAWNDAGMRYDTTLGYADRPGFRCGTCFEYPAFNPSTQKSLNVYVRPLIVMECTVINDGYLGLGVSDQALDKFIQLKDTCQKVEGVFTTLWHNSSFEFNPALYLIYKRLLE